MPEPLFIYGTLHPDRAPAEIAAAARRLVPYADGTIYARMYNFGAYPGVVLDETAPPVQGHVFTVPDAETLAALDAYEDYRPADPDSSLFLREKAVVTLDDGSHLSCWVYTYNGGLP